ncbi:MAG: RNA polymerase sigma factor [Myxococcales bacterium]|nr:RNA polymerase sigma factor [Myxococcales bacterium]
MGGQTAADLDGSGAEPRTAEDRAIEAAIRAGDLRQALSLCTRHHGTAVGRLCMALVGSNAEADDLVQETLLDAHAGFADWRGDGSLRAWLFGIARRKCARHIERTTRRTSRLRLVHDAERDGSAEDLMLLRQRAEAARTALSNIRPSEREAVVLRYSGELSYREVGQACGIDEAAARKRVSRALARLREVVKE